MSTAMAAGIDRNLRVFDEVVPARGRLAFPMYAGQVCRVVDLEGKQVADFLCFDRHDHSDKLSVNNTLLMNGTILISKGHSLYSTRATKLMTITDDTVGVHDLIAGSCSEGTNRVRYGVRGTPNCRTNFELALEPHGIPLTEIPYSFNIFMNVPVTAEKTEIVEPVSRPGDFLDLRAERDLLVAISNCPQERNPCNGFNPTPIEVVVYEVEPTGREL